ncbi:MAG: hypothetical protein M3Q75_03760, partial [Gemmatimonadota bacterium]|nr:hypothetical protein [Gemmatimonadota bacterium]
MDRRTIWAILLMMVIAIAPAILIKRPPPAADNLSTTAVDSGATDSPAAAQAPSESTPTMTRPPVARAADPAPADSTAPQTGSGDTVRVTSPLYTYGISTVGARLVEASLHRYRSMAADNHGEIAQILPQGSELLAPTLVLGPSDTIPLHQW